MTTTLPEPTTLTTHTDLIYAAALRQLRDPHAAHDVTQAVLIVALRKQRENQLPPEAVMRAWLLKITHFTVKEFRRAAVRREKHERTAAKNHPVITPHEPPEIEGLDEALLALPTSDRELLIRRYLEDQPVTAVAGAIGISQNTAAKRIARALDRLRTILQRRGISLPATTVAAFLTSQSLIKAPATLAAPATSTLATHLLRSLHIAKWKAIALVTAATTTLATITTAAVVFVHNSTPAAAQFSPIPPSSSVTIAHEENVNVSPHAARPPRPPLYQRYDNIFRQMNEKIDDDLHIRDIANAGKNAADRGAVQRELGQEQIRYTSLLWNKIEAATRIVAARHGLSLEPLNQAPELIPSTTIEGTVRQINDRMVIPIDDQMAQEIIDLLNRQYAATSQPSPTPSTAASPVARRYHKIFQQLNEKIDNDRRIVGLADALKSNGDPRAAAKILQEQIRPTATIWSHIEAATRQVAIRHNLSLEPLNQAPELPADLSSTTFEELIRRMHARMVIPIDDQMADEILQLANQQYAAATQHTPR